MKHPPVCKFSLLHSVVRVIGYLVLGDDVKVTGVHQLLRHALGVGVEGRRPPVRPTLEHAELLQPPLVRLVTLVT